MGLARRAGAVEPGVDAARRAVKEGRARLVLAARDGSRVQLDKLLGPTERADVPLRWWSRAESLGGVLGVPALTALAVTDEGFAEQILRRLPVDGA